MTGETCTGCGHLRAGEHTFVALWPIIDKTVPKYELVIDASADLPKLARQQHALLHGQGRWSVRDGRQTPGSNGARWVLVFMSKATHRQIVEDGSCNTCGEPGHLFATPTRGPVCLACWHDVADDLVVAAARTERARAAA